MTQTYIKPLAIALLLGVAQLPIANVYADPKPSDSQWDNDCSDKTGGSTNSLMLSNSDYECAYKDQKNNANIKPGQTKSWTKSTAPGYTAEYDCWGASSSAVVKTRSYFGSESTGSSLTYTATNTATSNRSWGAGVLWSTTKKGGVSKSQYKTTCDGTHGDIPANFLYLTRSTVTSVVPTDVATDSAIQVVVNVATWTNGPTASNTVFLMQQKDSSSGSLADPKTDYVIGQGTPVNGVVGIWTIFEGQNAAGEVLTKVPGNVLIYAAYKETDTTTQPIGWTGWVGSQSASYPVKLTAPASAAAAPALAATSILAVPVNNAKQVNISLDMPDRNVHSHDVADNDDKDDKDDKSTGTLPTINGVSIHDSTYKGYGIKTLKCPAGKNPVHVELMSQERGDLDGYISHAISLKGKHSITLSPPTDAPIYLREKAQVQLTCRDSNAPIVNDHGLGYGTYGNDVMSTNVESNILFAGLGDDTMSVDHAKSVAFGGPGKDRITVTVGDAAVNGGVGDDYIDATSAIDKVALDGGPGIDQVIGNHGIALINVLDGKGGDKVTCNSIDNSVIADKGDILVGPCTVVNPSDYE